MALAICFWIVDVRGWTAWTAGFLVLGTNPMLAYWLSSLVAKLLELLSVVHADGHSIFLETYLVDGLQRLAAPRAFAALLYSLAYTALWIVVLTPLFRRRLFVRI